MWNFEKSLPRSGSQFIATRSGRLVFRARSLSILTRKSTATRRLALKLRTGKATRHSGVRICVQLTLAALRPSSTTRQIGTARPMIANGPRKELEDERPEESICDCTW